MNHDKRNYILMFTDTVLFVNAMTFLSVHAVITYFLANLGASTFEIGLANALVSIGAFVSQPVFAKKVMNLSYKLKTFVKILLIQRVFFLLFVLTIPLFAEPYPRFTVALFLVCWAVFNYFVGAYNPFYVSLFAKMIANQKRGRLRGYSAGVGNLLALGSAYVTGILLKDVPFPYNYTVVFALGVLLLVLDALNFALMKEEPDQVTRFEMNYFQYFTSIPGMFRENRKFMKIVAGYSFMVISHVSLAYYALYAVRDFGAEAEQIALFVALTGLVNIAGSMLFGILADKYGHHSILLVSCACGGLAGVAAIAFHQLWAVYAAFAFTNLSISGYNLSGSMLIIDHVQKEKLPMSISINAMITLVVSSVVTLCGSFIVDYLSFGAIFAVAGAAGWISCLVLYRFDKKMIPYSRKRGASAGGG